MSPNFWNTGGGQIRNTVAPDEASIKLGAIRNKKGRDVQSITLMLKFCAAAVISDEPMPPVK
jgi:hypothetical protein